MCRADVACEAMQTPKGAIMDFRDLCGTADSLSSISKVLKGDSSGSSSELRDVPDEAKQTEKSEPSDRATLTGPKPELPQPPPPPGAAGEVEGVSSTEPKAQTSRLEGALGKAVDAAFSKFQGENPDALVTEEQAHEVAKDVMKDLAEGKSEHMSFGEDGTVTIDFKGAIGAKNTELVKEKEAAAKEQAELKKQERADEFHDRNTLNEEYNDHSVEDALALVERETSKGGDAVVGSKEEFRPPIEDSVGGDA